MFYYKSTNKHTMTIRTTYSVRRTQHTHTRLACKVNEHSHIHNRNSESQLILVACNQLKFQNETQKITSISVIQYFSN